MPIKKVTIWRLTYKSRLEPARCLEFFKSKEDAERGFAIRERMDEQDGGMAYSPVIIPLEVTLTKAGVLQFLHYQCPTSKRLWVNL